MTEKPHPVPLTPRERVWIDGLRSIAESPLKARIFEALDDLIRIGQQPGCPHSQADGVSCECNGVACDSCASTIERVEVLVTETLPPRAA
jgi:hypothetical protein